MALEHVRADAEMAQEQVRVEAELALEQVRVEAELALELELGQICVCVSSCGAERAARVVA